MPPPSPSSSDPIERIFKTTVINIKKHLQQCNVQDLVTNFNMVVNREKFPNFRDRVKEKLYKCKTIGDLFARISPFYDWKNRGVLKALVEVSGCPEAVAELKQFEAQVDYSQPARSFPILAPSSDICPDPESDHVIVSAKYLKNAEVSIVKVTSSKSDMYPLNLRVCKQYLTTNRIKNVGYLA